MKTNPVPNEPPLNLAPGVNEDSPVRDLMQRSVQTELSLETSDVILNLVKIVESVDVYSCYVSDTQQRVGDAVFKDESVRDLLLNITSSFKLNLMFANPPVDWKKVMAGICTGVAQSPVSGGTPKLLMPAESVRQLTSSASIDQILITNEWYATFMLLRLWIVDFTSWTQQILQVKAAQLTPPPK